MDRGLGRAPAHMDPGPRRATRGSVEAPRDAFERVFVGVWREVLGDVVASVHDDFFAVGGHSLNVTQVVARLGSLFG